MEYDHKLLLSNKSSVVFPSTSRQLFWLLTIPQDCMLWLLLESI